MKKYKIILTIFLAFTSFIVTTCPLSFARESIDGYDIKASNIDENDISKNFNDNKNTLVKDNQDENNQNEAHEILEIVEDDTDKAKDKNLDKSEADDTLINDNNKKNEIAIEVNDIKENINKENSNEQNEEITVEELSDEEISNEKEKSIKINDINDGDKDEVSKKESKKIDNNTDNDDTNDTDNEKNEDNIDDINITNLTSSEIKALGVKVRNTKGDEQKRMLKALKKLGKKASPATNEIIASLHEKKTANEAVDILINIGTETAILGLTKIISNSSNLDLSNYILQNIAKLGPTAEFATEDLIANFQNEKLKESILNALGDIQGKRAFYELKEILKSYTESDKIKILALKNLLKFNEAKNELPLLRRLYRQNIPSDFSDELAKIIPELEN